MSLAFGNSTPTLTGGISMTPDYGAIGQPLNPYSSWDPYSSVANAPQTMSGGAFGGGIAFGNAPNAPVPTAPTAPLSGSLIFNNLQPTPAPQPQPQQSYSPPTANAYANAETGPINISTNQSAPGGGGGPAPFQPPQTPGSPALPQAQMLPIGGQQSNINFPGYNPLNLPGPTSGGSGAESLLPLLTGGISQNQPGGSAMPGAPPSGPQGSDLTGAILNALQRQAPGSYGYQANAGGAPAQNFAGPTALPGTKAANGKPRPAPSPRFAIPPPPQVMNLPQDSAVPAMAGAYGNMLGAQEARDNEIKGYAHQAAAEALQEADSRFMPEVQRLHGIIRHVDPMVQLGLAEEQKNVFGSTTTDPRAGLSPEQYADSRLSPDARRILYAGWLERKVIPDFNQRVMEVRSDWARHYNEQANWIATQHTYSNEHFNRQDVVNQRTAALLDKSFSELNQVQQAANTFLAKKLDFIADQVNTMSASAKERTGLERAAVEQTKQAALSDANVMMEIWKEQAKAAIEQIKEEGQNKRESMRQAGAIKRVEAVVGGRKDVANILATAPAKGSKADPQTTRIQNEKELDTMMKNGDSFARVIDFARNADMLPPALPVSNYEEIAQRANEPEVQALAKQYSVDLELIKRILEASGE